VHTCQVHGASEVVVAEMQASLRSKETGRNLDTQIVELYRFTDGLISNIDVFYKDTKAVADLTTAVADVARA
jgi:hypothetical protein